MIHKNLNFIIDDSKGKYVLYLHGWGGNRHSLDILKDTMYTNMSLDFFCADEEYEDSYDTYESAIDVYLTLKEKGIHTLSIVAHSYGGRVAIILASMFDIHIENMVLIASAGINVFDIKKYISILNYKMVKACVRLRMYDASILQKYGSSDYKVLDKNQKAIFRNIVRQDLRYLLNNISDKVNVILVYGNQDKVTPISMMRVIFNGIKNSKCVVIKQAGHFCYITHKDIVKDTIKNNI